jgi:MscS family membrane protein
MIEGFWQEVLKVWDAGIFGTDLGNVFLAAGIFLLFLFARRIFFRTIMHSFKLMARVVIGLYVAAQFVTLSETLTYILAQLVRSLIAVTIFWAIFRVIDPLSSLLDRAIGILGSESMHETVKGFFVKVTKAVVVALGIAAVFQEWGFNVAAVLGSLGLVGMAVALGAQDLIKNMFAGLTIFLDRMFEKGNWIKTPDVEGNVEEIGFRATKVRQFDKALVTIPNSKLANEALINFSRMTQRRIYWRIGVEYRTTKEQLASIIKDIREYLQNHPDFETDPTKTKTFVYLDSFGASSIDILLYCFTKTTACGL